MKIILVANCPKSHPVILMLFDWDLQRFVFLAKPGLVVSFRAKNWRHQSVAILDLAESDFRAELKLRKSNLIFLCYCYLSFNSPMLALSFGFRFLEFPRDLFHVLHLLPRQRHLLSPAFSMFIISFSLVLVLLLVRMVSFHVRFQIGVLSEPLSTFRAGESVFLLIGEMNHLREKQPHVKTIKC